jgi:hypothetical protein
MLLKHSLLKLIELRPVAGYISGKNIGVGIMSSSQRRAVSNHRSRLRERGVVRLEVKVRKQDVPLVRGVVTALNDPTREEEARAMLRERFSDATGFKEFLLQAPIDDLDLDRPEADAREVEL